MNNNFKKHESVTDLNVASNKAVDVAVNIYEWINDLFKSFGIVAGGISASLADWVFGAVTMTVLLSHYDGFTSGATKWFVGGIFSLALWGIQIILWQLVLTGKIAHLSKSKSTTAVWYLVVFGVIGLMKFGDDFSDIVGVYWLIKDNPMQAVFNHNLYASLLGFIFFLVWVVCGFAEIFMALSINLLKGVNKSQDKPFQTFSQGSQNKQEQEYKQQHPNQQHNNHPKQNGGGAKAAQGRYAQMLKQKQGQPKPVSPIFNDEFVKRIKDQ